MKNYQQTGNKIEWSNDTGADVTSGQMIAIGDTVGIASVNIENGQSGTVSLRGVYNQIPKKTHATDEAFTLMQSVYFDGTAKKLTNTQAGNIFAGYAWQTAASDAGTATIKLHL